MKPTAGRSLIAGSFLILASQLSQLTTVVGTTQSSSKSKLITERSVSAVRLGMTVAEARKVLPGATLTRTTDGEGLALISVERQGNALMILYAGETNPKAPINKAAVIEYAEARYSGYQTAAGVHPKMTLREVEQKYGKLKEIVLSEIEGREYATFADQPAGIQLRVMNANGPAGNYPESQNKAESYVPTAYVFSISIRRVRERARQFASTYTNLKTQCKNPTPRNDHGQHTSLFCKGYGGYRIHIFDSATALHLNVETADRQTSIPLATQSLTFVQQGRKLEWRLANGKPFAVILRVFKHSGEGEYPLQEKPVGEVFLVKGLAGNEHIDHEVDIKSHANANVEARTLADSGYVGQR